MKNILILTNFTNEQKEDEFLADYLKNYFDVRLVDFSSIEKYENDSDLIIIRNTWPDSEDESENYHFQKAEFLKRAEKKNLNLYNSLKAHCDRRGKEYLVKLYKENYLVIPSFDSFENVEHYEKFLVKPKYGFSSFGIEETSLDDLKNVDFNKNFVQPKMKFKGELSFYCIDEDIVYALFFEGSKEKTWAKPIVWKLKKTERELVRKFLKWNGLKHGLCRVDFLVLEDDSLLLLEIEDDSPYLSFEEIDDKLVYRFLNRLKDSIESELNKYN
ncbi:hypothetical protein GW932_01550 [archaeon]|nr:hypothetical protein [archaeon]